MFTWEATSLGISIIAIILATLTFYYQFIKKGKLSSEIANYNYKDFNVDNNTCVVEFTAIFRNHGTRDCTITSIFFDTIKYGISKKEIWKDTRHTHDNLLGFNIYGVQPPRKKENAIIVSPNSTIVKKYEVTIPLEKLNFFITPHPPYRRKAMSNMIPFDAEDQVGRRVYYNPAMEERVKWKKWLENHYPDSHWLQAVKREVK